MTVLGQVTPILRSFDEIKAREFYLDYLGFSVVFEHRFADDMPLYMGIQRDNATLHLSEHHGDACPGSAVRIEVVDAKALLAEIRAKEYPNLNPGIQDQSWGSRELSIKDPFGNKITFFQTLTE